MDASPSTNVLPVRALAVVNVRGSNERLAVEDYGDAVAFYARLIRNAGALGGIERCSVYSICASQVAVFRPRVLHTHDPFVFGLAEFTAGLITGVVLPGNLIGSLT